MFYRQRDINEIGAKRKRSLSNATLTTASTRSIGFVKCCWDVTRKYWGESIDWLEILDREKSKNRDRILRISLSSTTLAPDIEYSRRTGFDEASLLRDCMLKRQYLEKARSSLRGMLAISRVELESQVNTLFYWYVANISKIACQSNRRRANSLRKLH